MSAEASSRPLVIGHRGAPGYRPEHTRSSYELAFALGADAVEPDLVATKDGVLVLRHENEISGTTDVASHSEFADRRTTKTVDGTSLTGWFTEDFTWDELSTLRAIERIPQLRASSAAYNGQEGILRLRDLIELIGEASEDAGRALRMVAEIKHASYFERIGLPLDELFAAELAETGFARDGGLIIEAFETTVLRQLRERGVRASYIALIEKSGSPADLVAMLGERAPSYADEMTDAGLARLAGAVDGISVDKSMLIAAGPGPVGHGAAARGAGNGAGTTDLVERAHRAGLSVFTWTLRPENRFLSKPFRTGTDKAMFGDWRAEFELVLSTGVDGIFVDQPDLGVAARDAYSAQRVAN